MCHGFLEGGGMPSFMTITSGPERNAMPNPYASHNKIRHGDFLVMDFGCTYEGYISDQTRTVFIEEASPRGIELFKAVVDIHDTMLAIVKPGVEIRVLQETCNQRMKELGYFDLWYHRAGHAIGREVHELPSIDENDRTIIEPGMVLAVEPCLYEYGIGPVRMEDNIIITKTGYEYMTNFSRDLIIVKNK
jgi:Xaa-Pro aminopeptidase